MVVKREADATLLESYEAERMLLAPFTFGN
jgi:hypothetical protein